MSDMAVSKARSSELHLPSKWKDTDTSPDHPTRLTWITDPTATTNKPQNHPSPRKVPVVYYLSRNGQLEHPHFMEVPLSSHHGLYLRDVINRLDMLRGKGMASLYSWSSKRSYKNGFVWHDLAENDFIYPAHGNEYVLKGSELLNNNKSSLLETTQSFRSTKPQDISHKSSSSSSTSEGSDFPAITRRRNQSWSSIDLNEYKVYKAEPFSESSRKLAADASTQTDDKRRRRRGVKKEEEIEEQHEEKIPEQEVNREEIEISPPQLDSSPETLESLMKADGRLILNPGGSNEGGGLNPTAENCGRMKASTVLMQLISCGSMSFRDCGATAVKEQGLSLIGQYKGRLPRGGGGNHVGTVREIGSYSGVKLEDKEYFSGSLIETKKKEEVAPSLKRSNSYNADQSSQLQLQLAEKEIEGVRTKCIPRKPRGIPAKKDIMSADMGRENISSSKRFDAQHVEKELE